MVTRAGPDRGDLGKIGAAEVEPGLKRRGLGGADRGETLPPNFPDNYHRRKLGVAHW